MALTNETESQLGIRLFAPTGWASREAPCVSVFF